MPGKTTDSTTHPSAEALAAFARGALASEESAACEAHVSRCSPCRQIVRDLRGEMHDDDATLDAAWEAMRPRLGLPRQDRPDTRAGSRLLRYAAVFLVIAAGAIAGIVARLQDEVEALRAPQAHVVEIDLFPRAAVRSAPREPTLTIPAGTRLVLLNLLLAEVTGQARLEILDSAGPRVWSVEDVAPDPLGKVTVALPRDLLPDGTYLLKLSAETASGGSSPPTPAIEYSVRVDSGELPD